MCDLPWLGMSSLVVVFLKVRVIDQSLFKGSLHLCYGVRVCVC